MSITNEINPSIEQLKIQLQSFGMLTPQCWADIKNNLNEKSLQKGECFSKKGQYNREFAFVQKGIGRIYITTNKGSDFTKYFFGKHDFLMASIEPKMPSEVNIQALSEIKYIYIPFATFETLLKTHKHLSLILNNLLLDYFGKKQQREINLLTNSALDNYQLFLKDYPDLQERIPHYHIASYLGVSPVQLSRIRKKMSH
ncbi:Crp/Fnr family transcriptional regulator [Aquimarina sp. U1-2]|uniref:Crp/Fnr family transcriptional regulator n=1 Tax=Aquimarina sp. U1-2 TaxID=2823141 RepID=UPI001AECB7F0|nr:Crp/Fnr family transcriptional regulator [Aquimarina sp. U1-2]MBP2831536.1 Crp/Fnr family transcriptional regulator [Aquimarina sp. U1-2]